MIGAFFAGLGKWLLGGGVNKIADRLGDAYEAKIRAQTNAQKLAADLDIQRLENALRMTEAANADRFSATSLGRYLIVLPFGAWWTAIFIDSIFNASWDVLALPPAIMELAVWLIPAIIVGDVGRSFFRGQRR